MVYEIQLSKKEEIISIIKYSKEYLSRLDERSLWIPEKYIGGVNWHHRHNTPGAIIKIQKKSLMWTLMIIKNSQNYVLFQLLKLKRF